MPRGEGLYLSGEGGNGRDKSISGIRWHGRNVDFVLHIAL
jgi:hypothetical protein